MIRIPIESSRSQKRNIIFILIYCFLALLSTGCQTNPKTISMNEAKQIKLEFEGTSLEPPPRSIDDLKTGLAIPEVHKNCREDHAWDLESIQKVIKRKPPYPAKGNKVIWLKNLAYEELYKWNYAMSIRLMEMAIDLMPEDNMTGTGNRLAEFSRIYSYAGDVNSAEKTLKRAFNRYSQSNYWSDWKRFYIASAKGALAHLKGNYSLAERQYRIAISLTEKINVKWQKRHLEIDLAENLFIQGKLLEAEIIAKRVLPSGRVVNARALTVLSKVYLEQGRYADAEYIAKGAIQEYLNAGAECSSIFLNIAKQTIARSLIAQEKWIEASAHFDRIRMSLQKSPEAFETRFQGDIDWAYALIRIGRLDEANQILNLGYEKSANLFGENHYNTSEYGSLSATILAIQGDKESALKKFMISIPILNDKFNYTHQEINGASLRHQRLSFIIENFLGLVADFYQNETQRKADPMLIDIAFRLADMARGKSVDNAIAASCVRFAKNNPELSDLIRRDQDTKKQLSVIKTALANNLSESRFNQNLNVIESLRDQVDKLEKAQIAFAKEIEDQFSKYAKLVHPQQPTIIEVQKALKHEETLISIYVGFNRSFVWEVPKDGDVTFRSVHITNSDVKEMVSNLLYSLEPDARTLADIPDFDLNTAHRVYSLFIKSILEKGGGTKSLIIVPDGPLSYLPFSLLPKRTANIGKYENVYFDEYRKVDWIIRHHSVNVLPSVSSLTVLRSLPTIDAARLPFVGFGDPVFSERQLLKVSKNKNQSAMKSVDKNRYAVRGIKIDRAKTDTLSAADLSILPRLPETADEILTMAKALGADTSKHVFLGKLANEQTVKNLKLDNYKVIAFASHGLASGDLDGLFQPGIALSSPKVTKNKGDGILTADEILDLHLNADWVVLSACNTGAGKKKGAEALSGLGRAFFYAGARSLLVSNWPVETTSAKALTGNLFHQQSGNQNLNRSEALRQSMQYLIDEAVFIDPTSGEPVFSYAHPIFWSAFTLVGD